MKLYLLLAFISIIGIYWKLRPVNETNGERIPVNNPVYCSPSFDPSKIDGDAPLLEGLGNIKYNVTTNSAKAQLYFNQGLALTYGFNHSEAARSFKTAIRLDTGFAMAYWGLAMVLGPNYNAALNPSSLSTINEAIDNAVKHAGKTKPNEQALIAAMAKRFPRAET